MGTRYQEYLLERYRALLGYIGALVTIIGALQLTPLLLLPFYPDEFDIAYGFLLAPLPMIGGGLLLWRKLAPRTTVNLTVQEGSVIVTLVWVITILSGVFPFMAASGLDFSQALFESASGWTSTGLTVVNVLETPKLILFYRSLIQLAGAVGFVIIALSAVTGSFSAGLMAAEGRTDQLAPHVRQSATMVLRLCVSYVVFGVLALWLAGMNLFDAVNHAFTALATGGFSTRPESIAYWDSPLIEAIIMLLCILGAINFSIAYAFLQSKIRAVLRSGELRLMALSLVVTGLLVYFFVALPLYESAGRAARIAAFEVVSAMTTAGFQISDYRPWSEFGWLMLILLMLVGGGTGSTAGAIKQLRVYVLYKAIVWEIKKAFMPKHMVNEPAIWQGARRELLNDRQVRQTALFIGLYMIVFFVGTAVLTAYGYTLRESLFEAASALGNVGTSVGVTQPDMPAPLLWVQSILMLLGRLEFIAVIVGVLKLGSDVRKLLVDRD